MDPTDQGLRVVWREKSFGQRLRFGARGGKSVPLGPRTIFLDRPKRPIHLPIIRKNLKFVSAQAGIRGVKIGKIFRQFSIKNADTSEQNSEFLKFF